MRRRDFVRVLCGLTATWPRIVRAQQAGRIYHLGMLWPFARTTGSRNDEVITVLFDELARQGFVEGKNLTVDYRAWVPNLGFWG